VETLICSIKTTGYRFVVKIQQFVVKIQRYFWLTLWLNGAIIETRRKKSKAILKCKNPAEMQKGL
jgi:hypothetical protein